MWINTRLLENNLAIDRKVEGTCNQQPNNSTTGCIFSRYRESLTTTCAQGELYKTIHVNHTFFLRIYILIKVYIVKVYIIKYIIRLYKICYIIKCYVLYNIIKYTDCRYVSDHKPKFRIVVASGYGRKMGLKRGPLGISTLSVTFHFLGWLVRSWIFIKLCFMHFLRSKDYHNKYLITSIKIFIINIFKLINKK